MGDAVVAAKMGVNHWDARKRNVLPFYGVYFLPLVKAFQKAMGISATGVIGPATWAALMPHIPLKGRLLLPQKPVVPALGPVWAGGQSVLLHDCTHARSLLSSHEMRHRRLDSLKWVDRLKLEIGI